MATQEITARNAMDAHAQDFRDDWHAAIAHSESISSKTVQRAHLNRSPLKRLMFSVCAVEYPVTCTNFSPVVPSQPRLL